MVVHIYMLVLDRAKRRIGFVSGEELADRQQSMSSLAPVAPKLALEWGDAFVEDLLDQELQHVIGLGSAHFTFPFSLPATSPPDSFLASAACIAESARADVSKTTAGSGSGLLGWRIA